MCARFTVLSDTPIASAIGGCVIPPSRSNIWMRSRCVGGIFHRSAVLPPDLGFAALDYLFLPNQMVTANHTSSPENNSPQLKNSASAKLRFNRLWRWYNG